MDPMVTETRSTLIKCVYFHVRTCYYNTMTHYHALSAHRSQLCGKGVIRMSVGSHDNADHPLAKQ